MVLTRHIDQWNRTKNLEINPCVCSQLTFEKGAKNIDWGKDSLFSKWFWGKLDIHMQKDKTRPSLLILYKNQLKID